MTRNKCFQVALFTGFVSLFFAAPTSAALVLIDLAGTGPNSSGAAADWDVFNNLEQDVANPLTDWLGSGDDDVTLTALDDFFDPNNPAPPGVGAVYDGITVPKEARDDYLFKRNDTAGTTARMKIENLDAGTYNVTVFEGRLSDASQFAKIWVGDATGSGEPAAQNTGNFAQGSSTIEIGISAGDVLWYRHLEDNTGGLSGIIVNPMPEVTGDVDGNGVVDVSDFEIIRDNFLTGTTRQQGNLDRRGMTDLNDFKIWRTAFEQVGAPASVPEPGGLVLLTTALCWAFVNRSSRIVR